MPWNLVLEYLESKFPRYRGGVIEDLDIPRRIASHFNVSLRAATIRLIQHGLARWELYDEIPPWSDDKQGGGPPGEGRHRGKIRIDQYGQRVGELFARAIHNDLVTHADAVSYLDIPSVDMEALERRFVS
jgi:hypothetical protein